MVPFVVVVLVLAVLRAAGFLGVAALDGWAWPARGALFVMLLLTGSAHFGKRRAGLIPIVPAVFPRPDLLVTLTGILELAAAIGLLIPGVAPVAAVALIALFVVMFPANIRAARLPRAVSKTDAEPDRPSTPLLPRTIMQAVFIAVAAVAGFG